MLSKTLRDALNEQIKNEFFSGYVYLSCAAYFENANLPGFAHWMRQQNVEEQAHGMRIYNYILNRGDKVVLQGIPQPPTDFTSPLDIYQQSLEHERQVTDMINRLYELAVKENDYPTQVELQWFIAEQVEEEKNTSMIVERLKMIGDHGATLFLLDKELGARA